MTSSYNGSFIVLMPSENRGVCSVGQLLLGLLDFRARLFASALINRHTTGPSHSPFFLIFFLSQPPSLLELRHRRDSHRCHQAWPLHHPEFIQRTRRLFVVGLLPISFPLSPVPRSISRFHEFFSVLHLFITGHLVDLLRNLF